VSEVVARYKNKTKCAGGIERTPAFVVENFTDSDSAECQGKSKSGETRTEHPENRHNIEHIFKNGP